MRYFFCNKGHFVLCIKYLANITIRFITYDSNAWKLFTSGMLLQCLRSSPWRCGSRRGSAMTYRVQSIDCMVQSEARSAAVLTSPLKRTEPLLGCWNSTTAGVRRNGRMPASAPLKPSRGRRLSAWAFIYVGVSSLVLVGEAGGTGLRRPGWSSPVWWVRQLSVGLLRPDTEPCPFPVAGGI